MDGEPSPLDVLLNRSLHDPPSSEEEARERLSSHAADAAPPGSVHTGPIVSGEDPLIADERPAPQPTAISHAASTDGRGADADAETSTASLAAIAAELSERAERYARLDERLAAERITTTSLGGLLRVVVTGDGRPTSLQISREAVDGPEGPRLGHLIADLITTARRHADARREQLEFEFGLRSAGNPDQRVEDD